MSARSLTRSAINASLPSTARSPWKQNAYIAALSLLNCEFEPTAPEVDKVRCLLEVCHHFCKAEAWVDVKKVLLQPWDDASNRIFADHLQGWPFDREKIELYTTLLGKLDTWMDALCWQELGHTYMGLRQYEIAQGYFQKSLDLFRAIGDDRRAAWVLFWLGYKAAYAKGTPAEAYRYYTEALHEFRRLDDTRGIASVLHSLGEVSLHLGFYEEAYRYLQESLALQQHVFKNYDITEYAWTHLAFGRFLYHRGKFREAQRYLHRGLQLFRRVNVEHGQRWILLDLVGLLIYRKKYVSAQIVLAHLPHNLYDLDKADDMTVWISYNLGRLALVMQNAEQAKHYFQTMLRIQQKINHGDIHVFVLEGLAYVAIAQHQPLHAARLFGAAEVLWEQLRTVMTPSYRSEYEGWLKALHALIDEALLSEAWAKGRAMSSEELIAEALDESPIKVKQAEATATMASA
ncbi:MAG: tetratricopeptide repeat protein [Caldilineaceae bacterium]